MPPKEILIGSMFTLTANNFRTFPLLCQLSYCFATKTVIERVYLELEVPYSLTVFDIANMHIRLRSVPAY